MSRIWATGIVFIVLFGGQVRGEEPVQATLRRLAESIEASQQQFPDVHVRGEASCETRVRQGQPGRTRGGQPSNAHVRYRLDYRHSNFDLRQPSHGRMQLLTFAVDGAMVDEELTRREWITPRCTAEAPGAGQETQLAERTSTERWGEFLQAFWIPGQRPLASLPATREAAAKWSMRSSEDGHVVCTFESGDERGRITIEAEPRGEKLLPVRYVHSVHGTVYAEHRWWWTQTPTGSDYPQRIQSRLRLSYPDQQNAIELATTRIEFLSVNETPDSMEPGLVNLSELFPELGVH
jgi:hypothetical protein